MSTAALRRAKAVACSHIDQAAGRARLRYITDIPGQDQVYQAKLEQARYYRAGVVAGIPTHTAGAYLAAEAQATGGTNLQAADQIIAAAALWDEAKGPAIEMRRRWGKAGVAAAATLGDVEQAMQQAIASLDAL